MNYQDLTSLKLDLLFYFMCSYTYSLEKTVKTMDNGTMWIHERVLQLKHIWPIFMSKNSDEIWCDSSAIVSQILKLHVTNHKISR